MSTDHHHRPPSARQRHEHDVSTRTIVKVCVALAAIWLLIRLWPIVVVVVIALVIVGTLSPIVALIERRGVKRGWALAIVILGASLCLAGLALLTIPALATQLMELSDHAPQIQARIADVLDRRHLTASMAGAVRRFRLDKMWTGSASDTLAYSSSAIELFGYGMTTLVLAVYILAGREGARGALYAWVPREYHLRLARITSNLEVIVGGYMRGQLITSAAIAVFAFMVLACCRVPNALALSMFAALTDVIPFVGGLLATTPAVLAALGRGLPVAGIVLLAMMMYQSFESRVLVPRIYGRVLRLSPAAVVIALLVGGKLLGIVGALLALPVAAGLRMIVEELRVELPGDDTDDTELRERDARAEALYAERSAGAAPDEAAAVAVEVAAEIRQADADDPALAAKTPLTDGKE